jgi:hypothetical protein
MRNSLTRLQISQNFCTNQITFNLRRHSREGGNLDFYDSLQNQPMDSRLRGNDDKFFWVQTPRAKPRANASRKHLAQRLFANKYSLPVTPVF